MNKYLKPAMILALLVLTSCSGSESPLSNTKSGAVNQPGACAAEGGLGGFSTLHIACRNTNMTANLMNYCMSNYKAKFDALSPACRSDFEALAPVRKGVTTVISNALKVQLGLNDPAKKDVYDKAGIDQSAAYIHTWIKNFSEAFYAQSEKGDYVSSVEGVFSQFNALIDQKIQSIILKDKTKLSKETSLRHELSVLESALKTYTPDVGSDLFVAARLNSALAAAAPKIETLIRVHDLACSISSCSLDNGVSNLPPVIQALGSLSELSFANSANAARASLQPDTDYYKLLDILQAHSISVKNVTAKALREKPDSSLYLSELRKIAEYYQSMKMRYQKEGFFRSTESHVLAYGFSEEARDSVRGILSSLKLGLVTDKEQYNAAVERSFQDLQSLTASDVELEKTKVSFDGLSRDIASHNLDILGLEEANRSDEASLARFAEQMKRIVEGNKDLANSFEGTPAFDKLLTIKASDSKFSLKELQSKREISKMSVASLTLRKGQTLNLTVTGEWSPVCALRETYSGKAQFRYDTIKTGPDGYSSIQALSSSNTTSREKFNSFVASDTYGQSAQQCFNSNMSGSVSVGPGTPAAGSPAGGPSFGAGGGVTGSQCNTSSHSIEFSHGYRDAQTSAESILDSAAFQGGLMLQNAPFVQYPAGSLLAFISPIGSEDLISKRIDVKVLGRQTSIYAPQDVTVSFVINDCQDGNFAMASGLSMQGEVLTPKSNSAKSLMENVLSRLPELRQSAEAVLKQGNSVDEQLTLKKSQLISDLLEKDANLYKISEIQGIINYWIDNEILKVKRMAQINAKSREMARLVDEASRLALQKEYLRSNTAVYRMRLSEALSRLSLSPLESSIGTVSDVVVKRILPVLKFYALANTTEAANLLKKSIRLEIDPFSMSLAVDKFLKDLSESIDIKTPEIGSGRQTSRFVVRFPRPDTASLNLPVKSLPTVDKARSVAFWRALVGKDDSGFFAAEPAISLQLKDVYSKANAFGLGCRMSNVVIEDMALIFLVNSSVNITDVENLNRLPGITMQAGPGFEFSQPTGSDTFMLRDPNEGNYTVKVGFLPVEKATAFDDVLNRGPFDQNAGKGLSPFTSFKFESEGLKTFLVDNYQEVLGFPSPKPASDMSDPFGLLFENAEAGAEFDPASLPANITDILLAFKVKGLNKNGELNWIETCK